MNNFIKRITFFINQRRTNCKLILICLTVISSLFLSVSQLHGQSDYVYDETNLPYTNPYYEQEDSYVGNKDTSTMETVADGDRKSVV